MPEIELKQLPCSVCGRPVDVSMGKTAVKCLEHSPEYWDIAEDAIEFTPSGVAGNDAGKVFVGRFLLPEEIGPYLAVQIKPNWAKFFCVHHTWSPTETQWKGYNTLKGIFSYYHYERGWTEGMGPHLWVAPFYKDGPWGVWIGTHPSRQGIGAIDWNYDTIHMETAWNGDVHPFSEEVISVITKVIQEVSIYASIPTQLVNFDNDGFANKSKPGLLFHCDTRKANKTCPGTKNPHDHVFSQFNNPQVNLKYGDKGTGVAKLQKSLQDVGYRLDITSKFDHRTDALVRSFQGSKGAIVTGIADQSTLDIFSTPDRLLKIKEPPMTGRDITWAQRILGRLSFYPLKIEDVFAPRVFDEDTYKAVIAFQEANNLPESGEIDEKMWKMLRWQSN